MNNFKHNIIICIIIAAVHAIDDDYNDRSDHIDVDESPRRFLDNLDDETWHIAHLKETDFDAEDTRRTGCKADTLEDKIRRYRKNLKKDGSLVEFVSADALPYNEQDLINDDCRIPDEKVKTGAKSPDSVIKATPAPDAEVPQTLDSDKETTTKVDEETTEGKVKVKGKKKRKLKADPEVKDTATTTKSKVDGDKAESIRRASEYMFSSVEYYDDVVDFGRDICPEAVDVIVPEQDLLRNYDVECELTLEWRSLV